MVARTNTTNTPGAPSITAQIAELHAMSTDALQAKYVEVHGEETRSRNAAYLRKKIAWRIQANAEGGLSERAKRRAALLADESAIRVTPPRGRRPLRSVAALDAAVGPAPERTIVKQFLAGQDARLPLPGALLTRVYKGREIRVTVLDHGFEYQGAVFRSLSAIAKAVTGSQWNGFLFFGLTRKEER